MNGHELGILVAAVTEINAPKNTSTSQQCREREQVGQQGLEWRQRQRCQHPARQAVNGRSIGSAEKPAVADPVLGSA